ncbi:hypothetical protein AXK11_02710 [Cephaloticoccus primus]|uniref:Outer membrane protein beta-barrel domain-containing protein n=1 Tax=Cephaloticoccus primus TaxID=1548207 RepID=A0A139SRF6_9BACT|nr:hypothetical protein [Cephaloticoccus primus]KXU37185.1 hypothetical protein AXK11_02710 [Cephaloticoccus primus]
MKRFSLLLAATLSAASAAFAQEAAPQPEPHKYEELPNFDFGDLHVEQKFSMSVGFRALSGAKVGFSGQGSIPAPSLLIDPDLDEPRSYNDGFVFADRRPNPPADGKTNSWGAAHPDQLVNGGADIAMHSYSAETAFTSTGSKDADSDVGAELVVERDMGKLGSKLQWRLFAGFGLNGISGSERRNVDATITTVTDLYSLAGQTLPGDGLPPYSAPSSIQDPSQPDDPNARIDTTVLLGRKPDSRSTATVDNDTQVTTAWKLKGNYLTFRAGPTLIYEISEKFRVSLSAGPVLVYSGTTYTVESLLEAETGEASVHTLRDSDSKVLTGYYVDATLQYMLNERAGFYAGAFYQASGDYTQHLEEAATNSHYSTDIDLSKLQGFRAGLNYRF